MSFLYNRPSTGVYGDPWLEQLALQGGGLGQPSPFLDAFGVAPSPIQAESAAMPPLLRLAEVINNGQVLSNQNAVGNLDRLNAAGIALGYPDRAFQLHVTGGDRYLDGDGNVRSSTNHQIVPGTDGRSPHLDVNGARAVDLRVRGIPNDVFDRMLRDTDFDPGMTVRYRDGHTHISLPPRLGR